METTGAPAIVEAARSLAALVALPLLAALIAAFSRPRTAVRLGVAASGGLLALAIVLAVRVVASTSDRVLGQHVAEIVRVGQLDLALDLTLDPMTAACVVLVALLSLAAVLRAVWTPGEGVAARIAWIELLTAGTIFVAVADAWPMIVAGLAASTVAAWGLSRGATVRPLVASLAGDAAVLIGACVLFWSLGGAFGPYGYTPDAQPRFAIVTATNAAAGAVPEAKVTVSLDTYADAFLVADDGPPLPGEPIRAPLAVTLDPGIYSFRILSGIASQDALVSHVTLAAGHAYILLPFGPTTSLKNLEDQLAVPRPSPLGPSSVRATMAARTVLGMRAPTLVLLLVIVGVILRLAMAARTSAGGAGLAPALEVLASVVLVLRIATLVDAPTSAFLGAIAAISAAVIASRAASEPDPHDAIRGVAAASGALAIACTLAGDPASALVVVAAGTVGCAAALSALDVAGDVRWLGVACAATAGVLPAAGASPGVAGAIGAALGQASAGNGAAAALAVLLVVAGMLVSLASLRVYDTAIRGARAESVAPGPRALAAVLAALALGSGAILGVGTSPFGGHAAPLARKLAATGTPLEGSPRLAATALGAAIVASAIGAVAARVASRRPNPPLWLGAPSRAVSGVGGMFGGAMQWLARSVLSMDREVIDDATDVLASAVLRSGDLLRRGEARAGKLSDAAVDRAATAALARAGLDDPRTAERVRVYVLIAMVAILALVVLSSLVLG